MISEDGQHITRADSLQDRHLVTNFRETGDMSALDAGVERVFTYLMRTVDVIETDHDCWQLKATDVCRDVHLCCRFARGVGIGRS